MGSNVIQTLIFFDWLIVYFSGEKAWDRCDQGGEWEGKAIWETIAIIW